MTCRQQYLGLVFELIGFAEFFEGHLFYFGGVCFFGIDGGQDGGIVFVGSSFEQLFPMF